MTVIYAPIIFEMTYTPVRGIKSRTVPIRDVEPVMVKDISADDAPIAVSAILAQRDVGNAKGGRVDYRSFDGKLWEPAAPYEVKIDDDDLKADDLKENPFVKPGSAFFDKDMPIYAEMVAINPKKPFSSKRTEASANLQAIADDMLMIDGTLFKRSLGPIMALKVEPGGREGSLILTCEEDVGSDLLDSMVFRVDEKDLALRTTQGLLGKRPVKVDFDAPDIRMPEALKADMTSVAILRTAHRVFIRDSNNVGIGNLSSPYLRLFLVYSKKEVDPSTPSRELVDLAVTAGAMLKDVRECGNAVKSAAFLETRLSNAEYTFDSPPPAP